MLGPSLSFGPYRIDPASGALQKDGVALPLGHRAAVLLGVLAKAGGALVTKDVLLAEVWQGAIVEEGNLTVQIAALRRALGPRADGGDWIVTVPRQGYRLIAPGAPAAADPAGPARLAVLPFGDPGGEPGQDYFADGVMDEIITALSRFRSFMVLPRQSALARRSQAGDDAAAARQLGADFALTGSVRRAGDRLRLSAHLLDVASGVQLWAEAFDGTGGDLFAFQDRIAENVVARIAPQIERAEIRRAHPGSLAAHDLFLRALPQIYAETEPANAAARALLRRALEIEPDNARCLAHMSWVLEHRSTMAWAPFGPGDRDECERHALAALERAQGDARLMAICAMSLIHARRSYDLGMAVSREAVRVNVNDPFVRTAAGVAELHCGSLDAARGHFRDVIRLGPGDPMLHIPFNGLGHAAAVEGDHAAALDHCSRSMALNPNFDPAYWIGVAANIGLGRAAEAQRMLARLLKLTPGASIARIRAGQPDLIPARIEPILDGLRQAGLCPD